MKKQTKIRVHIAPHSIHGSLLPRYVDSADLLEVSTTSSTTWLYGIDIDGRVIFDIDAALVLENFDLLIPQKRWQLCDSIELPVNAIRANILISESAIKHKSFSLPLRVITDRERSRVLIEFGTRSENEQWIELSKQCYAIVDEESCLVAFYVILD